MILCCNTMDIILNNDDLCTDFVFSGEMGG